MKKLLFFLLLTSVGISTITAQDNYFKFNGNADVLFRYLPRGNGGRALVHDANNTLSLNHGNDFTGGVKVWGKLNVLGDLSSEVVEARKHFMLKNAEENEGWRNSYFYYTGHSLTITIPKNMSSHTALELKPGSSDSKKNVSNLNLYESDGLNNYTKKVQIGSSNASYFNGGYVGIGTTNPTSELDVNGKIQSKELTSNNLNSQILEVGKHIMLKNAEDNTGWRNSYFYYTGHSLTITIPKNMSSHTALELKPGSSDSKKNVSNLNLYESDGLNNYTKKVQIGSSNASYFNGGYVGIGTTNPTCALDVRGIISAEEIKVEIVKGADHVFAKDYQLKPLREVESFIKENKHLPEIPSEQKMQENGLSINEFQIKLLQKIEELTLHVIEQEKKIISIQNENSTLKEENDQIKKYLRITKY
jgi:hypothetical protein